ncbi:hypothetical protein TWF694_008522 [Orbilia ellipsospora]|uniref:Uncharacterized protein n=1 Tax=Orbilia ellipsospora TaxID=2528407 RepID=A0AAV9XHM0_9PEZI
MCLSFYLQSTSADQQADDSYEGLPNLVPPPPELFLSDTFQRYTWNQPNERPMCLIDWSPPGSTLKPIGTRNCTDQAGKVDMGELWLLGLKDNRAWNPNDFMGLIGNCGTGRCMQYRPNSANKTASTSHYKAITYGTITSEVCDKNNDAQVFYLKNYTDPTLGHGIVPKVFNQTCPVPLEPTIIGGPLPSLIAFGCGVGEWNRRLISAAFGWYYLNITTNEWEIETEWPKYQYDLCCARDNLTKKGYFCDQLFRDSGTTKSLPDWWNGICTGLFPNYGDYDSNRPDPQVPLTNDP